MTPKTERQIKNGLRLGGGIGAFLIAAVLIGIAIDRLTDAAPGQLKLWPDVAIATGLIALAAVILIITARIWILYIAGCLLFAIPKFLIVAVSGRSLYSHESFSSLQAAELALFSVVSIFLIYRVTAIHRPGIADRLAFTFFLLALVFGLSRKDFTIVAIWQVAGVAALWLAWLMSRKRRTRRNQRRTGISSDSAISGMRSGQL